MNPDAPSDWQTAWTVYLWPGEGPLLKRFDVWAPGSDIYDAFEAIQGVLVEGGYTDFYVTDDEFYNEARQEWTERHEDYEEFGAVDDDEAYYEFEHYYEELCSYMYLGDARGCDPIYLLWEQSQFDCHPEVKRTISDSRRQRFATRARRRF